MKRRKIRLKTKLIIIIITAVLIALIVIFFNNATSVILAVSSAQLRALNTSAVNQAVEEVIPDGIGYGEIVTVTYDDSGDVSTISANSSMVNYIARRTAYLTQSKLTQLSQDGINIPWGAFTGIEALSGYGGSINVKIVPVIVTECNFISRFTSAGINQSLHSIYIDVVTEITIVLASRTEHVFASAEVLVCESLINGDVPQIYLQGGLLGSSSLVP